MPYIILTVPLYSAYRDNPTVEGDNYYLKKLKEMGCLVITEKRARYNSESLEVDMSKETPDEKVKRKRKERLDSYKTKFVYKVPFAMDCLEKIGFKLIKQSAHSNSAYDSHSNSTITDGQVIYTFHAA
jgi:hypothetical protein